MQGFRASRAFQGDIGENHQPVPPMMLEVSECDMRVTVNKSCALAAQTFMIAMANEGYDTCPLEGFDSRRMKKTIEAAPWGRHQYGYTLRHTGWEQRHLGRTGQGSFR